MSKHLIVLALALTGLTACGSNPGRGESVGAVGNQAGERYDKNHPR